MLRENELKYLEKIPEDKIAIILPFNPAINNVVETLSDKILSQLPIAQVNWIGASALGIAGQNDIDLHIFYENENEKITTFDILRSLFGEPDSSGESFYGWTMNIDEFEVELYISSPEDEEMKRQIKIFEILKKNSDLRNRYENLKLGFNGKSFREYQRAKYEFYNDILNPSNL